MLELIKRVVPFVFKGCNSKYVLRILPVRECFSCCLVLKIVQLKNEKPDL